MSCIFVRPAAALLVLALAFVPAAAAHAASPAASEAGLQLRLAAFQQVDEMAAPNAALAVQGRPAGPGLMSYELLAGVGAALLLTPASLALGSWLGSLSSDLVMAALPALLTVALVPPLGVTLVEWLVGERTQSGGIRIQPAVWIAGAAQVLLMVGAIAAGLSTGELLEASLFTLVDALILPATVTLGSRLTAPAPARPDAGLPPRAAPDPSLAGPRLMVPVLAFTF